MGRKVKISDKSKSELKASHRTKRCWSCNHYMKLEETHCPSCGRKVSAVNEHGVAAKPVEWQNYIYAIGATAGLGYFIWWAFFKG
jgi:hypothetical protein